MNKAEKQFNKWWFERFDSKKYKIIKLFFKGEKIQEYTTANKKYSDEEDAKVAAWVATDAGFIIDLIDIDGKQFKVSELFKN
ncbi:hypothetical protein ACWOA4_09270 [Pediococcus pentosaceus]|uniref:hypothetical protein n=1 Tax=Pediococcus pentosaceus TaxID=1255 RepID=UPI00132FEA73|nr:hypothetical protein [Pediococcus pentosaceus]KAF0348529.1 hypothetical protein GBO26_09470 [Pediococcus pentosaceus]